jgi:hypothetical protein
MPIHNTKMIEVQIAFSKFKRMKHPIWSQDLAARDFFYSVT